MSCFGPLSGITVKLKKNKQTNKHGTESCTKETAFEAGKGGRQRGACTPIPLDTDKPSKLRSWIWGQFAEKSLAFELSLLTVWTQTPDGFGPWKVHKHMHLSKIVSPWRNTGKYTSNSSAYSGVGVSVRQLSKHLLIAFLFGNRESFHLFKIFYIEFTLKIFWLLWMNRRKKI